jgi:hypothetical protein
MKLLAIVDEFLERWIAEELNCLPVPVPPDMATGRKQDDWSYWVPVKSSVTPAELSLFEQELGVQFSPQYKSLLKHKHFLELQIEDVGFFAHPSTGWQDSIRKHVLDGWPREWLLDKGFLPFAEYSDWGLWCFSIREIDSRGEYAVYLWDHDRPDQFQRVASTLESALGNEVPRASA